MCISRPCSLRVTELATVRFEFEEVFVSGLGVSRKHAAGIDVLERLDGRRRNTNVR